MIFSRKHFAFVSQGKTGIRFALTRRIGS